MKREDDQGRPVSADDLFRSGTSGITGRATGQEVTWPDYQEQLREWAAARPGLTEAELEALAEQAAKGELP